MNHSGKTIPQRLDMLVAWTGIPGVISRTSRPRQRRWSSLAILLAATFVMGVSWSIDQVTLFGIIGATYSMLIAAAVWVREAGPLRARSPDDPGDEREQEWYRQSNQMGFATVAIVAMIGVTAMGILMMLAQLPSLASPGITPVDPMVFGPRMMVFSAYLLQLLIIVPTLHASWTMPSPVEEDDSSDVLVRHPRMER